MSKAQVVLLCVAVVLFGTLAAAQVTTGTPPFASFGGGPFDVVNVGNLNVHFVIPIVNKAGRGIPFYYNLAYDSSVWTPVTSGGVTSWQPNISNWGWTAQSEALAGNVIVTSGARINCGGGLIVTAQKITSYSDPTGTSHGGLSVLEDPCQTGNTFSQTTKDGSGWTISYSGNDGVLAPPAWLAEPQPQGQLIRVLRPWSVVPGNSSSPSLLPVRYSLLRYSRLFTSLVS